MPIEVAKLSDDQLHALIKNHRDKKATNEPLYLEALTELDKRKGKGLDFKTSLKVIREAAARREFISYKDIADASGVEWNQAHFAINDHLFRLVEWSHRQNLPMVSAIIVNKNNIKTGEMEPDTLKGFIGAARFLGIPATDEKQFLREQQERVFEWGENLENG